VEGRLFGHGLISLTNDLLPISQSKAPLSSFSQPSVDFLVLLPSFTTVRLFCGRTRWCVLCCFLSADYYEGCNPTLRAQPHPCSRPQYTWIFFSLFLPSYLYLPSSYFTVTHTAQGETAPPEQVLFHFPPYLNTVTIMGDSWRQRFYVTPPPPPFSRSPPRVSHPFTLFIEQVFLFLSIPGHGNLPPPRSLTARTSLELSLALLVFMCHSSSPWVLFRAIHRHNSPLFVAPSFY